MKTYYGVVTTFDDNGSVTAQLVDVVEAVSPPAIACMETDTRDIYCDWFDNFEDALDFVRQSSFA